jgi:hypothetical protein
MNLRRNYAILIASALNDHIFTHDGECEYLCCPSCCATCSVLMELKQNPIAADRVRDGFEDWGANDWMWQAPDGHLDWEQIEAHWWPGPCQEGCER